MGVCQAAAAGGSWARGLSRAERRRSRPYPCAGRAPVQTPPLLAPRVLQAASKAVDAAAQNKDKVVAGIKDAGAKAGVSQGAVDTAANKVGCSRGREEGGWRAASCACLRGRGVHASARASPAGCSTGLFCLK